MDHIINLLFVLASCLLIGSMTGCGTGPENLDDTRTSFDQFRTHTLKVHDHFVYAGTDSGLFRKPVDPASTEWESLGLGDASVRTFLIFSEKELLASADFGIENPKTTIAKSGNGGESWVPFRNGYSGNVNNRVPWSMVMPPNNPDILYAGGPGNPDIAKSTDKGSSWTLVSGSWEQVGALFFLKVDSNSPEIIWAGGTKAILRGSLLKSTDAGSTWKHMPITGAEANVNDLLVKPGQSQVVIAGLEGVFSQARVLRKSTDSGQSWQTVHDGFSTRTMAHSASNSETIYASGRNDTSTLFFAKSTDFGDSWQEIAVPDTPERITVNDMLSVMTGGAEVLYFGTNKGVFSYRP